jgi:hypothetical protein
MASAAVSFSVLGLAPAAHFRHSLGGVMVVPAVPEEHSTPRDAAAAHLKAPCRELCPQQP